MIDRSLRLEAAKRLNLRVTDEEVAQAVLAFPDLQENGHFIGSEKYERALRASGYTPERFEEEVREGLLLQKYSSMIKASVLVPDKDLQREFSVRNDKASIEYVKIPAAKIETTFNATDKDLQAFLEKHKDRYHTAEQRKVKYLLVDKGQGPREDQGPRGGPEGRVRAAQGKLRGARAGHRVAHPDQGGPGQGRPGGGRGEAEGGRALRAAAEGRGLRQARQREHR